MRFCGEVKTFRTARGREIVGMSLRHTVAARCGSLSSRNDAPGESQGRRSLTEDLVQAGAHRQFVGAQGGAPDSVSLNKTENRESRTRLNPSAMQAKCFQH